ncbi:MAG: efflux RND transporter permease subunit [Pseudomonadota bacterium]|nr:efflux RND transporter permease subunit [Pseudomonadota bacterium]
MSWPRFSLNHRHTIFAALIALVILGVQARFELPVRLFPDTDPPVVTVITAYPGVAASDVAKDLSKTLEEELAGVDGVAKISSSSQTGSSVVKVELHYDRTVAQGALDVQNAISRVRQKLPEGIGEPRVLQFSSSDKPILTIAVRSDRLPLDAVRELADNEIRDRLQLVEGVAAVDVFGAHKRQLEVQVRRDRLRAYGLTLDELSRGLAGWNLTESGGRVELGTREAVARFDMPLKDPADVESLVVAHRDGRDVRLGEIAEVTLAPAEPRSAYHFDGEPDIAVQVIRRDEANTVEVAHRIKEELAGIQAELPYLQMALADDDSAFTELVIDNMTATVLTSIVLVIGVVLLFLAHLRQAAIIALSIPVAFLMTFVLMQWAGIELNLVTLSAIILSIGLLVDDGIVVLENVNRHLGMEGKTPMRAAIEGTEEIFLADLAGTVTTIAVLVPLMFLGGFVGKLFGPLALTIAFALSASFLVSVTLIPVLSALWLRPEDDGDSRLGRWLAPFNGFMDGLKEMYLSLLGAALRHPWRTLAAAAVLLVASARLMAFLGNEMLPRFDAGNFQVLLDTIPGTPLEQTLAAVSQAEAVILGEPEVTAVSTQLGFEPDVHYLGSRGAMDASQAEMVVNLTPRTEREDAIWEIMERVRAGIAQIPGVTLAVLKEKGGTAKATTTASIDLRLSGPDSRVLDRLADRVLAELQQTPGVRDPYKAWGLDSPELRLTVDRDRAASLGLDGRMVAAAVYQAIEGRAVTPYRQAQRRDKDIYLRYAEPDRQRLDDLLDVHIQTPAGAVPVRELVSTEEHPAPRLVTREDFRTTLDVLAYHHGRPLSDTLADIQGRLADLTLPADYRLDITGEQSDFLEARQRLIRALALGVLAVYLVLVAQFRSFKHPLTIMMAVPLQFIGAAAALLIAGKYLSMPALLGIILLVGTVVNNSIVLIDYTLERRRGGMGVEDALADAVSVRFRPIMMTALSDVAGMLPLAMETAVGAERFSPIATVIIGGILAATLLTLVVIPVLFRLLERPQQTAAAQAALSTADDGASFIYQQDEEHR